MNVFQVSFCFDAWVVLFESSLEEMLEEKETVDLPSDVFLVVNFTVLNSFFIFAEKTKLGSQSVEELLKKFEDYSVWIWEMFWLLVWVILLKEGYIFIVAFFQIFPGLKQVHKKGKCHNGYSTSF